MLSILLFLVLAAALYVMEWYAIGFVFLALVTINNLAGAFRATRNPEWYARVRAAKLGESEYTTLTGPSKERLQADIQSLLLTKMLASIPLAAGAAIFAFLAWGL